MINLESSQAQPVREEKRFCWHCQMTGYKKISKEELKEILYCRLKDKKIKCRQAIDEIKAWEDSGSIICPKCEGRGFFSTRL